MVIQTIIAPIPSEGVIIFASAIGINILTVTIFGGIGLIIGGVIAFFIARYGGRPIVEKLIGDEWVENLDEWVDENGMKAILVTRLIPIIPFDLISYVTGVTSLKFKDYMIATVIGAFPRCFMLALIGTAGGGFLKWIGLGIEIIIVLGTIGIIVLIILDRLGYIGGFKRFLLEKLIGKKL